MRNDAAFHAPLHPLDSEKQTCGCRHTNPDICAKNGIPKVCALVRSDKEMLCASPILAQTISEAEGRAEKIRMQIAPTGEPTTFFASLLHRAFRGEL